jgi:hypothetical protein
MIDKTLEQLEKDNWGNAPIDASNLVVACYRLRRKKLKDFSVEDLRIMINQNMSLEYLVPIAVSILQENPFAEGDNYEGDLLKSILTSDKEYWNTHKNYKNQVVSIWQKNQDNLNSLDTTEDIKTSLKEAFGNFVKE